MQKLVAKTVGKLDEFIVISSVVKKDDKIQINLVDMVETYKDQLRKKQYGQTDLPKAEVNDTERENSNKVVA